MKSKILLSVLLTLLIAINGLSQSSTIRFKHLTYSDGLSNSNVYTFVQDKNGFMWIGTEGGLFRYDGIRFKMYKNSHIDSSSLNSNVVFSLLFDSEENMWVGTYKGINIYNASSDNFIDLRLSNLYTSDFATTVNDIIEIPDYGVLLASSIGVILIDPITLEINHAFNNQLNSALGAQTIVTYYYNNDILWIGTEQGLFRYDLQQKKVRHYNLIDYNDITESNIIVKIFEDKTGDLWVATRGGGIFRLDSDTEKINNYVHNSEDFTSIGSNECYDFIEKNGELWISTKGGGLYQYNRQNNNFIRITNNAGDKFELLNNNIRTIYEDNQGNLWISSFQSGINILVNTPYQFKLKNFDIKDDKGFVSTSVISFFLDNDILWIGTDGGGLKRLNRISNDIITFRPAIEEHYFPDKVVMNIHKDQSGMLWMGTYLEGLISFNPETYDYVQYKHNPEVKGSISNNFISSIYEDSKGRLWIGTNGGGLNLFNRESEKFKSFRSDYGNATNSLVNNYINVIDEDYNGNLWIGTYWGLSRFNPSDNSFTNFLVQDRNSNNLNSNIVYSILSDSKNRIWIGTRTGLAQFNFQTNAFINYSDVEGLSSNQVNGILEDNNGMLWISTDDGIIHFNPESKEAMRFAEEDGLQGNEFYHNSCHKAENNELFFGGYNGYNSFFADSIKKRFFEPEIVLTDLSVLGKEVKIGEESKGRVILKQNITLTDKVKLKFSDKSFTLGFAAVDFIEGNKNIYTYKLENFDDEWKETNARYPFATYTNLSPGEYLFRVKAGKPELIDQVTKERQITILITPPFWRTKWAFISYVLFVVLIVAYFWRLSIQRIKERNIIKLEKVKREQTEAISQARLRFFTNISHEIRTPLTLIIGPLEQLIAKGSEVQPYRKQFDIMLKNARRLLRLINQLLDLRKNELGKSMLQAEEADISKFVKDIALSFEEHALDNKIDFKFTSKPDSILAWFDPDKMDKIIFNLLSNAFKYTPKRGKVSIELKSNVLVKGSDSPYIEIHVSDTGRGISENDLKHIFERFYQGKSQKTEAQTGWGLGLSLTDSFVRLHRGKLQVDSVVGVGTNFKVLLPMDESVFTSEEKIVDSDAPGLNKYIHLSSEPYIDKEILSDEPSKASFEKRHQLLIIEDNKELREYLLAELEPYFNCFEATDGEAGLEMAIDIMPDLILSDIMMPGKSGIELCRELKDNIITSHIPVILLTAKSNIEDQIIGFESGADAYIPKPFNIEKLIANANSLLKNRQLLREKLSGSITTLGQTKVKSDHDKFLNLIDSTINDHLSDLQFGVEELSGIIGISRTHLHRKMKAIAGQGPNAYIRRIRLQKAAELLLEGELSITEVSMETGFNSTSYFSSTFKSYFKVSPKDFVKKNTNN